MWWFDLWCFLKGTSRGLEALQSHMTDSYYMLRGQGGYKIRLELAIRTPGCPLKRSSADSCVSQRVVAKMETLYTWNQRCWNRPLTGLQYFMEAPGCLEHTNIFALEKHNFQYTWIHSTATITKLQCLCLISFWKIILERWNLSIVQVLVYLSEITTGPRYSIPVYAI